MDILRFLPINEYNAAVGASSASGANPFATITDLGDYLPLSGGVMTGNIDFSGSAAITASNSFFTIMGSYIGINAGGYGGVNQSNFEIDNDQGFTTNLNSSIHLVAYGAVAIIKNNIVDYTDARGPVSSESLPISIGSNYAVYKQGIYNTAAIGAPETIVKTANTAYVHGLGFNLGGTGEMRLVHTPNASDFTATLQAASGTIAYLSDITGGNTIYTADDSLLGNRTVDLNGNNLTFGGSGNLGIGIAPTAKLHVKGSPLANSLVLEDSLGSLALRVKDDLSFEYGDNLIIRRTTGNPVAGIVDIGATTVASPTYTAYTSVGRNTIGVDGAIAYGTGNTVNFSGVAIGSANVINTSGFGSTAVGFSNNVADRGVGIGYVNAVIGSYGISIGNSATSNQEAISIGRLAGAATGTRGNAAISIGRTANNGAGADIGSGSIAIGGSSNSEGEYSVALGQLAKAEADWSVVIGSGFSSFGGITNNIASSIMLGSGSTTPTMTITSNGFGLGSTAGKVGIGTTAPLSKLSVVGDIETTENTNGLVVLDRTDGERYRIYTDNGILHTEQL